MIDIFKIISYKGELLIDRQELIILNPLSSFFQIKMKNNKHLIIK